MILLSLDASTKNTGWAIFKDNKYIESGVISSSSSVLIKRIYKMTDNIKEIIKKYNVDTIILEEVLPSVNFNAKTTVWKALTWLQAGIMFMLYDNFPHIKIDFLLPNSWRSKIQIKTGKNHTREELKRESINYVKTKYNISCGDDQADAICLATAYLIPTQESTNFLWQKKEEG